MPGQFVQLPSGILYVHDYGGGGDPVIAVHGLGGAHLNWLPVAEGLTRHGRVLAVDLPGFGYSPPQESYRLSVHIRAVIEVIEHTGRPAMLLGNSMGGLVALLIASHRPDLVTRLVLVAPASPPSPTDPTIDRAIARRLLLQGVPILGPGMVRRYWQSVSPARQVSDTLTVVCRHPERVSKEAIVESLALATARRHQPWAIAAVVGSGRSVGRHLANRSRLAKDIARITAPTLLIKGSHDRVIASSGFSWLSALRPDWEVAVMEDSGHCPQLEAPAEFTAVLDGWLSRQLLEARTG